MRWLTFTICLFLLYPLSVQAKLPTAYMVKKSRPLLKKCVQAQCTKQLSKYTKNNRKLLNKIKLLIGQRKKFNLASCISKNVAYSLKKKFKVKKDYTISFVCSYAIRKVLKKCRFRCKRYGKKQIKKCFQLCLKGKRLPKKKK